MTQLSADNIPEQLIAHCSEDETILLLKWWNNLDVGIKEELANSFEAEKPERDDFLTIEEYLREMEGTVGINIKDYYEYLVAHDLLDSYLSKNYGRESIYRGFLRGGTAASIKGYKPPIWRLIDKYRYKFSYTI